MYTDSGLDELASWLLAAQREIRIPTLCYNRRIRIDRLLTKKKVGRVRSKVGRFSFPSCAHILQHPRQKKQNTIEWQSHQTEARDSGRRLRRLQKLGK